jgi:UDP-glucose 4-epimerase
VAEAAGRATGRPIPTVACPRRPGDPPALVAAVGRAEALLGWRPRHSDLEGILTSAWAWHRAHPRGYES